MTSQAWVSLVACAGLLALAVLALARVGKSVPALPLSLLAIALSTWNFTDFAYARSGEAGWRYIAITAALMTVPFTLHFILSFVGQRRRLAWAMFSTYAVFGAAALAALGGVWLEGLARRVTSLSFARLALALVLPVLCANFVLLALHLRREPRQDERARTGVVLLGLILLVALMSTELSAELGWGVPRLGYLGTLLGLPVMAIVALRLHLFGEDLSARAALQAAPLALGGVLAYLAVFRLFAGETGVLVVGTVISAAVMAM